MKGRHLLLIMGYFLTLGAGLAMGHKIGRNQQAQIDKTRTTGITLGLLKGIAQARESGYQTGFQACQDQF